MATPKPDRPRRKTARRQHERTAYHEAGHAVVAHRLEVPFRYVTIVPDEKAGSLGHILHYKWSRRFQPDVTVTPLMRERMEHHILSIFAGGLAERKWSGRYNRSGSSADQHAATTLASYVGGEGRALEKYLAWLLVRAENAVDVWWPQIAAVAEALLAHPRGRLTLEEMRILLYPRVEKKLGEQKGGA